MHSSVVVISACHSFSHLLFLVSFLVPRRLDWRRHLWSHGQICLCKVSFFFLSIHYALFTKDVFPCLVASVFFTTWFRILNDFRSAFELWGHGKTHDDLRTSLLSYPPERMVGQVSSLYNLLCYFKQQTEPDVCLLSSSCSFTAAIYAERIDLPNQRLYF